AVCGAAAYRMMAMVDSGADSTFTEAMADLVEFEKVCAALEVPVLANMTEFGKSELFTREQLAAAGIAMVIYPVTLLRSALGAAERVLDAISAEGSQASQVDQMYTSAAISQPSDYAGYNAFDFDLYNVSPTDPTPPDPNTGAS